MANDTGGQSPQHLRGHGYQPYKRRKPPSQASGQAGGYVAPGSSGGVTAGVGRRVKRKARNVGNALLPGNPFG